MFAANSPSRALINPHGRRPSCFQPYPFCADPGSRTAPGMGFIPGGRGFP